MKMGLGTWRRGRQEGEFEEPTDTSEVKAKKRGGRRKEQSH